MIARRLALFTLLIGSMPSVARAQGQEFGIVDNSFFVEEAFNQEQGVFQNIFNWSRSEGGGWEGSFTQEWPAPGMTNQLSYTVPFVGGDSSAHFGGAMINYRFQAMEEGLGRPAISPRFSVILPTGRAIDDSNRPGIQVNLPVSKQVHAVYIHANAGLTWINGAAFGPADRRNLTSPFIAGSLIFNNRPLFNLMIESIVEFEDAVRGVEADLVTSRKGAVTVSPGFRGGWNIGDRQIIVGAALPVTRSDGETTAAVLTYFSYELRFRANRGPN